MSGRQLAVGSIDYSTNAVSDINGTALDRHSIALLDDAYATVLLLFLNPNRIALMTCQATTTVKPTRTMQRRLLVYGRPNHIIERLRASIASRVVCSHNKWGAGLGQVNVAFAL